MACKPCGFVTRRSCETEATGVRPHCEEALKPIGLAQGRSMLLGDQHLRDRRASPLKSSRGGPS